MNELLLESVAIATQELYQDMIDNTYENHRDGEISSEDLSIMISTLNETEHKIMNALNSI